MAKGSKRNRKKEDEKKRSATAPATQTRGLTGTQRSVNKATGVNNSYNFNRGSARDSAETFARAFMNSPMATASDKAQMKKDMRNSKRRKSNGGSGG